MVVYLHIKLLDIAIYIYIKYIDIIVKNEIRALAQPSNNLPQ